MYKEWWVEAEAFELQDEFEDAYSKLKGSLFKAENKLWPTLYSLMLKTQ